MERKVNISGYEDSYEVKRRSKKEIISSVSERSQTGKVALIAIILGIIPGCGVIYAGNLLEGLVYLVVSIFCLGLHPFLFLLIWLFALWRGYSLCTHP